MPTVIPWFDVPWRHLRPLRELAGEIAHVDWDQMMNSQERLTAKVTGYMYIAEGVVAVAGGLFLLWITVTTPLLPIAFGIFIFVALLVPAAWFIRMGRRSLDKANEP